MNQNENMGAEITLTEENESTTAMYDLSHEDFAALTANATVLELSLNEMIQVDTCVHCVDRSEHWFQLLVLQNADYNFSADVCVGARLYDEYGNLLAFDNEDGEKNSFVINHELDEWTAYYLRVMPKFNYFMRFNTVITNTAILVESIRVSPDAITLIPGEKVTLSATVVPQNATEWRLIWSSSDNNVVQVGQSSGEVTAVSLGTAIIYAEAMDDSGKRAICTVTVVNLKENVEYHIVAFAGETNQDGNQMALHVWERNDRRLYMDTDLPGGAARGAPPFSLANPPPDAPRRTAVPLDRPRGPRRGRGRGRGHTAARPRRGGARGGKRARGRWHGPPPPPPAPPRPAARPERQTLVSRADFQ